MEQKRILLVDVDDQRRATRVSLLRHSGYQVETRKDFQAAENSADEGQFDLVIVALHAVPDGTGDYTNRLAETYLGLPILLLTDMGVFVPTWVTSRSTDGSYPAALMAEVASMLTHSLYICKAAARA